MTYLDSERSYRRAEEEGEEEIQRRSSAGSQSPPCLILHRHQREVHRRRRDPKDPAPLERGNQVTLQLGLGAQVEIVTES